MLLIGKTSWTCDLTSTQTNSSSYQQVKTNTSSSRFYRSFVDLLATPFALMNNRSSISHLIFHQGNQRGDDKAKPGIDCFGYKLQIRWTPWAGLCGQAHEVVKHARGFESRSALLWSLCEALTEIALCHMCVCVRMNLWVTGRHLAVICGILGAQGVLMSPAPTKTDVHQDSGNVPAWTNFLVAPGALNLLRHLELWTLEFELWLPVLRW